MAELKKRYFVNSIPDYMHGAVDIDTQKWKSRILNAVEDVIAKQPPTMENCEGGLYVGCAGIAYALCHLAHNEAFKPEQGKLLQSAEQYATAAYRHAELPENKNDRHTKTSFLLGNLGVYAVAAVVFNATDRKEMVAKCLTAYAQMASLCLPTQFVECGSDELFVGRAGYLCGLLMLNKKTGQQVLSRHQVECLFNAIIKCWTGCMRNESQSPSPLMYAYYIQTSILQMLLSFPDLLKKDATTEKYVRDATDFVLSLEQRNGNYPAGMDEVGGPVIRAEEDELIHWCHGAGGVVYLFARAYLVWKDTRYLEACKRCADLVWKKGLLRKGPGICHGVAGSGYVFLLLYRLTEEPGYLHRALRFADFVYTDTFRRHARTPDRAHSLYEGWAGTMLYLSDLLHPEKAEFPLFNVFF
ncbi:PREDICTED: lanC-like protein 3 [Priapulus caudatus]|uniref:LanC-like protein 3 n=1 Tax=Priapulus caudatus TaxID=37621 RepID=A0ABM1ESU9_PRICU|nr:PREDICTED: lanC-like protein 3 [Priapulus caudatus]